MHPVSTLTWVERQSPWKSKLFEYLIHLESFILHPFQLCFDVCDVTMSEKTLWCIFTVICASIKYCSFSFLEFGYTNLSAQNQYNDIQFCLYYPLNHVFLVKPNHLLFSDTCNIWFLWICSWSIKQDLISMSNVSSRH